MLLDKKIRLEGTRRERVVKALEMAGWYKGRSVDITAAENYYEKLDLVFYENAKKFFREYYGLAGHWWIDREYKIDQAADFEFILVPDDDYLTAKDLMFDDEDYKIPSDYYINIERTALEKFVYAGIIGYYYPARVWIGESGKIYATHEYDFDVHVYDSVIDLIEWELARQDFDYVTVQTDIIITEKPWEPPVPFSEKYRFKQL